MVEITEFIPVIVAVVVYAVALLAVNMKKAKEE